MYREKVPLNIIINVYYSLNLSYQKLACQLTSYISKHSFAIRNINALNLAINNLLLRIFILIIVVIYNSKLAYNIVEFISQVKNFSYNKLTRLAFAIFRCSYYNQHNIFLKILVYLDNILRKCSSNRIAPLGTIDVAFY